METETYLDLVEIQSLDKKVLSHQKILQENQKRIDFLTKQRKRAQETLDDSLGQINKLNEEFSTSEVSLTKLGASLDHANKSLHDVTDERQANALNSEIDTLTPKIKDEEEKSFTLLEKIEELEKIIEESRSFIKGSLDSLEEIQSEVSKENQKEEKEINTCEERISFIRKSFKSHIEEVFDSIYKKYRFKNPIAIIETNVCPHCSLAIPANTVQNLPKSVSLELCPGCERILIPKSALKI